MPQCRTRVCTQPTTPQVTILKAGRSIHTRFSLSTRPCVSACMAGFMILCYISTQWGGAVQISSTLMDTAWNEERWDGVMVVMVYTIKPR